MQKHENIHETLLTGSGEFVPRVRSIMDDREGSRIGGTIRKRLICLTP